MRLALFMDVSCSDASLQLQSQFANEATRLAIEAVNADATLLVGHQLVGQTYDTTCSVGGGLSSVSAQ